MAAFLPSTARIQSQGRTTLTARSVTRVAPRSGCDFLSRGERNVQCQDQKSSGSTWRASSSEAARAESGTSRAHHCSSFDARSSSSDQREARATRRWGWLAGREPWRCQRARGRMQSENSSRSRHHWSQTPRTFWSGPSCARLNSTGSKPLMPNRRACKASGWGLGVCQRGWDLMHYIAAFRAYNCRGSSRFCSIFGPVRKGSWLTAQDLKAYVCHQSECQFGFVFKNSPPSAPYAWVRVCFPSRAASPALTQRSPGAQREVVFHMLSLRSEERRVGKECRSRW